MFECSISSKSVPDFSSREQRPLSKFSSFDKIVLDEIPLNSYKIKSQNDFFGREAEHIRKKSLSPNVEKRRVSQLSPIRKTLAKRAEERRNIVQTETTDAINITRKSCRLAKYAESLAILEKIEKDKIISEHNQLEMKQLTDSQHHMSERSREIAKKSKKNNINDSSTKSYTDRCNLSPKSPKEEQKNVFDSLFNLSVSSSPKNNNDKNARRNMAAEEAPLPSKRISYDYPQYIQDICKVIKN